MAKGMVYGVMKSLMVSISWYMGLLMAWLYRAILYSAMYWAIFGEDF